MKRTLMIAPALLGVAGLLAAADAAYPVGQAQQAVLLRLGQPVAVVNDGSAGGAAGLHLKWPFVEQVAMLDHRTQELQTSPVERAGAAPTTLQAQMRYRIADPLRFYRTLGNARLGEQRLSERLQEGLERVLPVAGGQDGGRAAAARALLDDLRPQAAGLGVELLDVRLVDAAPSSSTVEALATRMQDAETRQVAEIKADGEQNRRDLLAQADRDAAAVRAEGERQALEVRGAGDAQRAAILGDAYGKDPAFARFFRRLEAYDQAFNPDNTTLVLSPDNAFLDVFEHGPAALGKPPS